MWYYENKLYDEAPKDYAGFVYLITDLVANKNTLARNYSGIHVSSNL